MICALPEMKQDLLDDAMWREIITRDFYPCGRVWNVLDSSGDKSITLYSHVLNQRKILSMQIATELEKEQKEQRMMKARERLRVLFLIVNILLSWLSLPYLGVLQILFLLLFYESIIRSLTVTLIPLILILLILIADVLLNFCAWLVSQLNIERSVFSHQWENMGFTFVKFTYEELYQERKRSFFYIFALFLSLFCFALFVGLRTDHWIRWPWPCVFVPFWIAIALVFQTVPVRSWSKPAAHLYLCLLFLFGIPLLLFSVLLVVKLQWLHSLYFVIVFIPLWIMDLMLTILVLGPTIVEFVQQSIMRNIRGIMDTLDLLCFYSFIIFPKIIYELIFSLKDFFSQLSYSLSCIPLFIMMVYVCVITTSVCIDSFSFHHRVFSFYFDK
ncbi:hypothetical protein WA577_000768 [Blastocystis sp. JDR]